MPQMLVVLRLNLQGMWHAILGLVAGGLLCLTTSPSWAQGGDSSPGADCDRLAASPYDPAVPAGNGVAFEQIDATAAVAACEKALEFAPDDAKLRFQLARALDAAGRADEAIAAYERAIDGGSLLALSAMGTLYEGGYGVEVDLAKAADFYQRAADAGLPLAMTNLASLYEEGRGVAQDYARAASLYKLAADAGSALGAGALGFLTERGLGVAQDDVEAVRLYRIGAEGGEAFAQRNLGVMFTDGRGGLEKSPEEAFKYFKQSADQHYAASYLNLALSYANGLGTTADVGAAETYLRLAIAEGDAAIQSDAQNDLAWIFARGNRNLEEAEALAQAAVSADPEKAHKLDTLAWVLHLAGKSAEALPLAEKAVSLDGSNAEYADHLAAIRAGLPG